MDHQHKGVETEYRVELPTTLIGWNLVVEPRAMGGLPHESEVVHANSMHRVPSASRVGHRPGVPTDFIDRVGVGSDTRSPAASAFSRNRSLPDGVRDTQTPNRGSGTRRPILRSASRMSAFREHLSSLHAGRDCARIRIASYRRSRAMCRGSDLRDSRRRDLFEQRRALPDGTLRRDERIRRGDHAVASPKRLSLLEGSGLPMLAIHVQASSKSRVIGTRSAMLTGQAE